jgi:hypothetical protein
MSEGGEDTKEDGAEESEDEIHIEKARSLRFGGRGVLWSDCHPEMDAQADVGHGINLGTIGQIPGFDRVWIG